MQPCVGHINFLNCQPLTYSLLKCGYHRGISLVMGVPSVLNKAMEQGQLHVSPMSSFAFGQMSISLMMLPNLGIVADGIVQSIILVSKRPIDALDGKKILLTAQSATSHCLLKIIMRKAYKCIPQYEVRPLDPQCILNEDETADLFIGDDALYINHNRQEGMYYYDLGNEWKKMTGLPMVYAVWAATRAFAEAFPEALREVYSRLRGGFDHGNAFKKEAADMVVGKKKFSRQQLMDYFDVIKYDVHEKQLTALNTFYTLAHEYEFLETIPAVTIADIG
ncbi:menaquinone biosynthetic enzyme MqnA/MqnD family protein [Pectinatus haikarae]|uniref:menaquinone biosynthetic enzyme MqnA/MqnD family protein n=1 Tax=Pectinatus haikarae TaxID=349096 RepID=UPI001E31EED2|nr:menaquinone biosynthesis protein [Pectinatus haikarae]